MENIEYSRLIISTTTKDGVVLKKPHRKYVEIASENLQDFNERLKTNTQLEYHHEETKFSIFKFSNNPRIQYLSREFVTDLNRLIQLYKADFDQRFIRNEYVENRKSEVEKLKQEIRTKDHFQNGGLSENEKKEYLNLIQEFIILRENSYPKVVLSNKEEIQTCIEEVNNLCQELPKEFVIKKKS